MVNRNLKVAIQAVLAVVIVFCSIWLVRSVTEPWIAVERAEELTEMTQTRMTQLRTGLVLYERQEDRFPGSLDSLIAWVRADSLIMLNPDSVFEEIGVNLDSLLVSPRTGSPFLYALNDTGRVHIYLLEDPDTDDRIGSANPDITLLNAASWE